MGVSLVNYNRFGRHHFQVGDFRNEKAVDSKKAIILADMAPLRPNIPHEIQLKPVCLPESID